MRQVMVSCSVPTEVADQLYAQARQENRSLAFVMRRIIVAYFETAPEEMTEAELLARAHAGAAPTAEQIFDDLLDDVRPAARAVRPIGG